MHTDVRVEKLTDGKKENRFAVSHLLEYSSLWSVNTIPGIERFFFKNIWKDDGGSGLSAGSWMSRLYFFPVFSRAFTILLTCQMEKVYRN